MTNDPRQYCIKCDYGYHAWDESCPECGFDPVGNELDEAEQAKAERAWDND